ncbi:hypothetical protein DSECCO2_384300 [anaerobic digester metagenome]
MVDSALFGNHLHNVSADYSLHRNAGGHLTSDAGVDKFASGQVIDADITCKAGGIGNNHGMVVTVNGDSSQ